MWVLMFFFIFICPGLLSAGTSGKITGTIKDAASQEPMIGANVLIDGTTMGAATSTDGNYVIINVPPGIYKLRLSMVGYKMLIIENVRVNIDQTTTINAGLTQTVLDAGESVTIVAERPLVQMDMTSSQVAVGADEIDKLPVQTFQDILEMQAGVVRSGDDLHIRGGRGGEVAYWVDGVSATDFYNGNVGVKVENAAIQQLQVISGTFNAEYGQAMSGIINIITKEGSPKYTGEFKAYAGDYISTDEKFGLLKRTDIIENAKTGVTRSNGVMENPLDKFNPTYDTELTLSGPVPFAGKNVTFFANGRYYSNEGYLYGRKWFTPQGNPGDSSLVPMNPYHQLSLQGKLVWRLNSNFKIGYNLFFNQWKNDRFYIQDYRYNPDGVPQALGNGFTHIFSINHVLSTNTFYEFRLNRFNNDYQSYVYENPLQASSYLVKVPANTELNIPAHTLDPSTPEGQAEIQQLKQQRVQFFYFADPQGPQGYVHPDSNQVPASYSFLNSGTGMDHVKRTAAYWVGKFDLTSQATRSHQFKAGFEVRLHELTLHSFTIQPKLSASSGEPITPFEPAIPAVGNVYRDDYDRKPREFSAYVQDKMELSDLIVNLGLRFDYFDANAQIPVDRSDPNIYYPFKDAHIYKDWVPPPKGLSQEELTAYYNQFVKYTPEQRRGIMQKQTDAKMALSPRLGIAYPITNRGVIHFSYGHFFQIPNFEYLYANPDFKLSAGGGFEIFGNPNLNPQVTVQYEIGLQQQLTDNIGVDVTAFYKDIRDLVQTSPLVSTPIANVKYSMYINRDYGNVRGITFSFTKRQSNSFAAWLDYSFQIAEGTYSNPSDAYVAYVAQQEPRLAMIPLEWDQKHTLNGRLIYSRNSWTVSLVGRYWTGRPYTPSFPVGVTLGAATLKGLKENTSRLPAQRSVDLYIEKRVPLGALQCNVFVNVYNLFDTRDDTWVWTDTGSADYTTTITPERVPYNAARIGTVENYITHPDWYTAPRWIQAGVAIDF
jgi:outer membrane receptor protein involved in Fe transport